MFDKIKQLNELRKQSQTLQKDLDQEVIEVIHKGIKIQISAGMQIKLIETNQKSDADIAEALNKAIKESQKIAAQRMRGQLSALGLNIPGL